MAIATFAAGCFWEPEMAFGRVRGVSATAVGYTGGTTEDPSYEEVCTGTTGHAEAVRIEYDSEKVSYAELLALFWEMHDPTQLNRQGPDVGSQYRTAIFFHDSEQEEAARASKAALEEAGDLPAPIVTEIVAAPDFHLAEDYHQKYFEKQARGGGLRQRW